MLSATLPLLVALAAVSPSASAGPPRRATFGAVTAAPPPAPDPAPAGARMIRVQFRDVAPEQPAGSFGAKPKILYRLGEKYGRMEEEPDPEQGIHGLIVVAEPKVWMINLADMSGRMAVDPGPSFVFRAPVIPETKEGPTPPMLELGHEYEFLRAHGAKAAPGRGQGEELLTATVDGYSITLTGEAGRERARRLRVAKGGETLVELEYLDYQVDLPPQMELFVPPAGVRYRTR